MFLSVKGLSLRPLVHLTHGDIAPISPFAFSFGILELIVAIQESLRALEYIARN